MYTAIQSAIVIGVDGTGVTVEVDITSGIPQINVVGLPDSAIRESIERVRAAIKNSKFRFPPERITINLAPADLRKEGTGLDLAIAAGILSASEQLPADAFNSVMLIGELALNGEIRPVHGILAMLEYAKSLGINKMILPHHNLEEAHLISDIELFPIHHLTELLTPSFFLSKASSHTLRSQSDHPEHFSSIHMDMTDIIGQQAAKRAMLIAAAGRHNIIVAGPPGVGKTMLIQRLPTILPPLEEKEALEVTKIYSVAGKINKITNFISVPPFRAPHHSISIGGLVGGGSTPKPGEITLAHHGILFLDELPEFSRSVLELLRQPLEEHKVTISRAKGTLTFPANFLLAASLNPCPCGYYGYEAENHSCSCSSLMIQRYLSKLSGPLLDRIDLQIEVTRPSSLKQTEAPASLTSKSMREQVLTALSLQRERNSAFGVLYNSQLSGQALKQMMTLPKEASQLLDLAFKNLGMSMRGYERILKIARTIADLAQSEQVHAEHIAEAIQYRKLDLQLLR